MSTTSITWEEFGIKLDVNHSPEEFNEIIESLSPEQHDNLGKELRSRAANKVLKQYNTVETLATPPSYYSSSMPMYPVDQVQNSPLKIGLGTPSTGDYAGKKIPKEVLISASLGIPEGNVDLSTGLPTATRYWASLSAVPEEKEKYLEIASGGELKKINIDGANHRFVLNPDGTLNPIDEEGLSRADFVELLDYLPEVAGIATEIATVVAFGAPGAPVAFVAGPLVEATLQERSNARFRNRALNPALKEEKQGAVNLYEGSLARGAVTLAWGLGGNALGVIGGRVFIKNGVMDIVNPSDIAKETAKAMSDLQKEATKKGIDLRLPDIPFGDATMRIANTTDPGKMFLQDMIKRLDDFGKNIYDPEYLIKNKKLFEADLERIALDQVEYARYMDAELRAIDVNAATAMGDSLKKRIQETQNLKASKGEHLFSQDDLSATHNPFNEALMGLKDRIYKISDDNYDAVKKYSRSNPSKNPIKVQDFFKRMEKKLSKDELNQLAEIYAIEIKTTPTLGIKGEDAYKNLKSSSGFDRSILRFDSVDKLYRLRSNIGFKEGKEVEKFNFEKALKEERFSTLDYQGKKLLKNADGYYRDSVSPMKGRILKPAFDSFTDKMGKRGVKEREGLVGVDNVLKNKSGAAVEKFDLAIRLFDEAKDEAGKQQYIKSLRGGYLLKNGAFTGNPSGQIIKPTVADALLQKKLFGNQYEGMFGLLRELKGLGGSLSPDAGRYLLDNVSKLDNKRAELLYDQLRVLSKEKIQRKKDLGEILFNSPDQVTLLRSQGMLAEFVTAAKISSASINDFLSKFGSDIQRDAFKARVIEELFANNQKSGYLFDGKKVIEILNKDDKKYKTLFGAKKLSVIKKYADVVARIPKADASLSAKATEFGNSRVAATMDGSKVRFYYRWLAGLSANPQKAAKILGLHLQSIGQGAESSLKLDVLAMNPDYLVDEILVGKVMSRTLATDDAISLLFAQDDPIAAGLRNDISIYSSTIIADQRSKSPEAILGPE